MNLVLPVLVGLEQGPDQQQGGADGTNQVCGKRAEGQERGVRGRGANEIAGKPDPAGNDKQRKHHEDKWEEIERERVPDFPCGRG